MPHASSNAAMSRAEKRYFPWWPLRKLALLYEVVSSSQASLPRTATFVRDIKQFGHARRRAPLTPKISA